MSAHKRKWQDTEDSDEDEPSFGRQILPVARLPENYSNEPMDGMQYLFTVRRDARRLPNVTRVANPYEVPAHAPVKQEPPETPLITLTLPSEEWRSQFLKHFQYFRKNIVQPTNHVQLEIASSQKLMPDKKERDLWWKFLAGRPHDEWNPAKRSKKQMSGQKKDQAVRHFLEESWMPQGEAGTVPPSEVWQINGEGEAELAFKNDPMDSLPTPNGTPPPLDVSAGIMSETRSTSPTMSDPSQCHQPSALTHDTPEKLGLSPPEPTHALLRRIDHRIAVHLLMYFAHWINLRLEKPNDPSTIITPSHGRWMFALLAKIDDYVQADDMSHLRSLARGCISLIKEMFSAVETSSEHPELLTETIAQTPRKQKGATIDEGSCWMVFAAVAGVWAQKDLWMDVESSFIERS
ncbi:hypothetical protein CONPUDRAFT_103424 [Coniophora puteana RWD-64-598 SS2]|uniref:Uncharacterized protein n=1 Tax=Coniophora puteana (strain RWD-64-598) TaxID=741705 RepID=A0A5M3MTI8_CONPW|nr:uncharacterized protein CONPUDRAFT_103424 [Coniophora puteana RWD-64-598 SS2]EIW82357.1 hypothetical protein CONPUDRAFT_103424 [Coniophora puteana RWD-64-598 SS2]